LCFCVRPAGRGKRRRERACACAAAARMAGSSSGMACVRACVRACVCRACGRGGGVCWLRVDPLLLTAAAARDHGLLFLRMLSSLATVSVPPRACPRRRRARRGGERVWAGGLCCALHAVRCCSRQSRKLERPLAAYLRLRSSGLTVRRSLCHNFLSFLFWRASRFILLARPAPSAQVQLCPGCNVLSSVQALSDGHL
jgi:hypothetical protein